MAERELAVVLRDVDPGTWRPPRPDPAPTKEVDPTFHEFASDWYASKELEVEPNTANHYRNDLINHLLPFFKGHHLSQITVAEVDRYRQHKVREAAEITAAAERGTPMMVSYVDRRGRRYRRRARSLSARSINMHIDLLAQILAVAVDHGHVPRNPALGKRRRRRGGSRAWEPAHGRRAPSESGHTSSTSAAPPRTARASPTPPHPAEHAGPPTASEAGGETRTRRLSGGATSRDSSNKVLPVNV